MSREYKSQLEKFSQQLSDAIENEEINEPIFANMINKQIVIMFCGYEVDSDWHKYTIRIMGKVVKGAYMGFLYDALESVCHRTKFYNFRIQKRTGQFTNIYMLRPYKEGDKNE